MGWVSSIHQRNAFLEDFGVAPSSERLQSGRDLAQSIVTGTEILADLTGVNTASILASGQTVTGQDPTALDALAVVPAFRVGKHSSRITKGGDAAIAPAKRNSGQTVLGNFPAYKDLSEKIGARRFEVPQDIWKKMSANEQWSANQKFLDRTILRGDDILLSTPIKNIDDITGYYRKEIDYLIDKGYRISKNGKRLIP